VVAPRTAFPARPSSRPHAGPAPSRRYERRRPEQTPLYKIVSECLEGWLADRSAREQPVAGYVEEEFRGYLTCGVLCFGFARALCTRCPQRFVVAFSCKRLDVFPSCNGRHMAQTAAHLVDHVIPPAPVRQWVISVPKRRRGFLDAHAAADMLAWANSGFSIDASVRITLLDRDVPRYLQSLEHLLRYCALPPFALERLSVIRDADGRISRTRYVLPRHKAANWVGPGRSRKSTQPGASGVIELAPFEFLDRLADLIPQPRRHRHRYHGVFAPNHPLRPAVTSLAVGNVGKQRNAATGGHGGDGHGSEGCWRLTPAERSSTLVSPGLSQETRRPIFTASRHRTIPVAWWPRSATVIRSFSRNRCGPMSTPSC
jgi:hypothetical protein